MYDQFWECNKIAKQGANYKAIMNSTNFYELSMAQFHVQEECLETGDEDVNEGGAIATQKPKQVLPLRFHYPM